MKFRYVSHRIQLIKSFYSGIGKTAVIFPSTFLVSTGVGIVSLGIIFYVRDIFGVTPSEVGFLSALWSFLYVIGCLFVRPFFNRILPRFLLIISSFLMSVLVFSIIFIKDFSFIYFLYGGWGLAMSLFWPPIVGWLSQGFEGKRLGRVMSNYNFSWGVGISISPFLAGFLSSINRSLPIVVGASLFFITTVLITGASLTLPLIKNDKWIEVIKREEAKKIDRSTPLRFPSWVGIYSTYVVIGVILTVFPLYARQVLGYNEKTIGLLLQERAIFAAIGFIILGRTSFWHFNWKQIVVGHLLLGLVVYIFIYVKGKLFIGLILAVIGFLMSLSYFNSVFHGVSGSPKRSARMAINEAMLSSGLITGSSVGGIIFEHYSMQMVYLFCFLLALFTAVVQMIMIFIFYKKGILYRGMELEKV